jgi:ParB family chromosome partitioning protein
MQTQEIALNKLLAWNGNVRRTGSDEGIEELAASIAAVGLLQNIVVAKQPRGKFAVIAGRRRLLALSHLVAAGDRNATWPVPCRIATQDADKIEISLAENEIREPMNPADVFEAFQALFNAGKSVADIAARFGISESVVLKRLTLAKVSPALLQNYRDGKMNLDTLQAFTLTDDHTLQEEAWNGLQPWSRDARTVRQLLSHDTISATDKRVRFVGVTNYEADGGLVRRDLFSESDDRGVYILDPAKLARLVDEKLNTLAEQTKAEGWKWVEIQPDNNSSLLSRLRRIPGERAPLTAKEAKKLQQLNSRREKLQSQLSEKAEEENERLYNQIEELEEQIDALHANCPLVFPESVKAHCGAVISIDHNGAPAILRGLLRKEDQKQLAKQDSSNSESESPGMVANVSDENRPRAYSAALVENLTQHKTAALAAELSGQPLIALAAVVHAMVLNQFSLDLHLYRSQSCVQVSTTIPYLKPVHTSRASEALLHKCNEWMAQFPRSSNALWEWCLTQDQETLLRLLAFLTAQTVNAVRTKGESASSFKLQHADSLATALHFDMSQWFTPTANNFFGRISKAQIAEAMAESGSAPGADALTLKKAGLAAIAEKTVAGIGWLPEPVRISTFPSEELSSLVNEPEEDEPEDSVGGL